MTRAVTILAAAAAWGPCGAALAADAPTADSPMPIQDNSFLVEEAYNQEPGVVQHVNTFQRPPGGTNWAYTLSEEWPVGGLAHQFGFTGTFANSTGGGQSTTGLGDLLLNYRWQAIGNAAEPLNIAPRHGICRAICRLCPASRRR